MTPRALSSLALLVTILMVACSGGGGSSSTTDTGGDTGGDATVTIDTTPASGPLSNQPWLGTWVLTDENGNVIDADSTIQLSTDTIAERTGGPLGPDGKTFYGTSNMRIAIAGCYIIALGTITSNYLPTTDVTLATMTITMTSVYALAGCAAFTTLTMPLLAEMSFNSYLMRLTWQNNNLAVMNAMFANGQTNNWGKKNN